MKRILVIGGGIAGPVTAMALQNAGMEPIVCERHTEAAAEQIGAYLTVAVNGLSALSLVGAHNLVTGTGHPTPTLSFATSTNKHIAAMPIGGALPDGTVTHSIKRRDLYRVLNAEAVRRGVPYEYGKRLADASMTQDGRVRAKFADGTVLDADVLVGADGIHSRTRQIIDPGAPKARYLGIVGLGGFVTNQALSAELNVRPGTYNMIFGKHAFFGYLSRRTGRSGGSQTFRSGTRRPGPISLRTPATASCPCSPRTVHRPRGSSPRPPTPAWCPCSTSTTCRPCRAGTGTAW
ncbi:FAD-dependent oxidoreductase [Streptomyces guryensis]|uniref:FAD-dependent monooxygenase n=1 Tax=Streptomyces guryensis TaxID=2886947 RepID=A0A9Q3VPV8_9ACTN|nr:FAD-dependent monooxygenase [Streptomyces guryensis]MCD9874810.1 FAD-dependent monooxygenase [Streptomyces guryensis]